MRKRFVRRNWHKVLEVAFFAIVTSTTFFMISIKLDHCIPKTDASYMSYHRARCQENEYSPMATLFFNTEGGTIRAMLSKGVKMTTTENLAFLTSWYVLFSTTYGIQVPSGIFLPGIIIGLSVGQLYGNLYTWAFPSQAEQLSYLLVGAHAMLVSYCHLTYSLAVIMLETTQSINLFIPMIFATIVSLSVSKHFSRSLYDIALRTKNIPLLREQVPFQNRLARAFEVCTKPPLTLQCMCPV